MKGFAVWGNRVATNTIETQLVCHTNGAWRVARVGSICPTAQGLMNAFGVVPRWDIIAFHPDSTREGATHPCYVSTSQRYSPGAASQIGFAGDMV